MTDLLQLFEQAWAFRALVASVAVGITCGLLGTFIVLRNMSLIGDALSHAVLPGVVLAFVTVGYSTLGFFVGSVLAGIVSAVAITLIQQHVSTKNDAAIGIVFTAMFSLGVIGISGISKNDGVHLDLKDFLFGNVLGVSDADLYLTLVVMAYVIISVLAYYRYFFATTFDPTVARTMGISVDTMHYFLMLLLAFAVVSALQTVGVILVVAMLITPAATALLLAQRLQHVLWLSALLGALAALAGLWFALWQNTTPGPAMAVAATLFYVAAVLFAPRKGRAFVWWRKRAAKRRILQEDILKLALRAGAQGSDSGQLARQLGRSKPQLLDALRRLRQKQWTQQEGRRISLSPEGERQALALVRAHRLWETYQVHKMGLRHDQIHDEAEAFEHWLSEEMLEEMDIKLGFPETDPHGSPIPPSAKAQPPASLASLPVGEKASIRHDQLGEHISAELWRLGLLPDEAFEVLAKDEGHVHIRHQGQDALIPLRLAGMVAVEK